VRSDLNGVAGMNGTGGHGAPASSAVPALDDDLVRAYGENLSHRLPLIYGVVIFNTLVLSAAFFNSAPILLTLWLPLALALAVCSRA